MGPYKSPFITDDVVQSSAFQSIFDMPSNQFVGLNSGYIKDARDARPGPVVEGEDGEMYAQDSTYTLEGWETEQTGDTPLYYYANSQELGDVYEGNYFNRQDNGNISVRGRYQSEADIKAEWDADQGMGYFKEANPDLDFDTYFSFVKDTSSLVNQGLNRDEDPEPFNALADQYGINTSFQNDDGDMFEFNGSNFTKTFKTPEADYGKMLWSTAAGVMGAQALAPFIGGFTGAAPAGFVGPPTTANVIGGKIAAGVGAGATNAATQAALTGKIDPASVLSSAVINGVNPGGMLTDKFGKVTGTGTNIVPSNVVGGFLQGATNSSVSQLITDGNVDLESALLAGGMGAGMNAITDLLTDTKQFSIEGEMERIAKERAAQGLNPLPYEELYFAATGANPNFMTPQNTSNSMTGPPSYSGGSLVGKSDLGGLVGKDGLLSFIPEVPTGFLNKLTGGGAFAIDELYSGPDGKMYTDIELYQQGIDPTDVYNGNVPGFTSYKVTKENNLLGDAVDFAKNKIPGVAQVVNAGGAVLDVAADAAFDAKYGINPRSYVAAGGSIDDLQRIIAYGELDETYNFSENPRGDSQYVGLLTGINDGFSAGSNNNNRVYTEDRRVINDALEISGDKAISDAGKDKVRSDQNSNVIINLGPDQQSTIVNGAATLPGSNITIADAVLQGFIDGALLEDTDLVKGTVPGDKDTVITTASDTVSEADTSSTASEAVVSNTETDGGDLDTASSTTAKGDDINTVVADVVLSGSTANTDIDTNTKLTGTEDLPSGGGGGGNRISIPSIAANGLPLLWGDLYGYKNFKGYSSDRMKLYENMIKGLGAAGIFAQASNMSPMERELYEAGELRK